ncbi:MAG: GntR family transcriptional regulator [Rhodobacteraceae bacterium]|nr:GntR family transcriptional regulator [Paracoccaceae bacterium]
MLRLEAYEKFKEQILSGELKPGQMVSQRELANIVGVPLGPAREAIQRLAFESLLRVHPNRGVQVSEITYRTIRSAYQMRSILETAAIKAFVQTAEDEQIMELIDAVEVIIARSRDTSDADFIAEAVDTDWKMHEAFVDSMRNDIVSESFQINHSRIVLFRLNNRFSHDRLGSAMREHLSILECCLKRESDAAVNLLCEHISTSKKNTLAEL